MIIKSSVRVGMKAGEPHAEVKIFHTICKR
jgi:hypothetical protein